MELKPTQSNLYTWTVGNNITAASTPAEKTFKTQGFDIEVTRVAGSIFNASGAVLPTTVARDRVLVFMRNDDSSTNFSPEPVEFFSFLEMWNDYYTGSFILKRDTNISFTFSVDTTTSHFAGTYPLRVQLAFYGRRTHE